MCVWVSCGGRREEGGRKEEGRTGGSAGPKTRTPHNDVGKKADKHQIFINMFECFDLTAQHNASVRVAVSLLPPKITAAVPVGHPL